MRDPARIHRIVVLVESVWHEHPDWRLGQLITNMVDPPPRQRVDLFNIDDDDLEDALRAQLPEGWDESHTP